jgi:hypothetical protein
MVHRGFRSLEAVARREQRKSARHFIYNRSFYDDEKAETVCTLTTAMVTDELSKSFQEIFPRLIVVEKGEVLKDSRGQGSFQQLNGGEKSL